MARRFSTSILAALDKSKILGIRAGDRSDHRFIGIWVVVVEDRVFVRSWTLKPGGWYRTLLDDPLGTIQAGDRHVRIRAARARGAASARRSTRPTRRSPHPRIGRYVRGFRTPRRRETTMELMPRPVAAPQTYEIAMRIATPIGVVRSQDTNTAEIPKGLGAQHEASGVIEVRPEYEDGLKDIEGFSHLYVIWVFDRAERSSLTACPPSDDRPHGVFATRSPERPNPIRPHRRHGDWPGRSEPAGPRHRYARWNPGHRHQALPVERAGRTAPPRVARGSRAQAGGAGIADQAPSVSRSRPEA